MVAGKVQVCRYVELACKRQLDDIARAEAGKPFSDGNRYTWDTDKAERLCKFIEMLPHTKGRWAAKQQMLKLEPWQCFVRTTVFGWKRENGFRRFRESYEEIPRKNGKSPIAAAVGLFMLTKDGEYGAEVYSGATTEKQAWEIFRPARMMARRSPTFLEAFNVQVNASNLCVVEDQSRFEPIIGQPGDGAAPSCALLDEFHEHATPEQYDTMVTGMVGREQPLMHIVTTAGVDTSGPCYEKRREVIQALEGNLPNEELFGIIYTIDDDDDWSSELALIKANPNLGVSVDRDTLIAKQKQAIRVASKQGAFKTKHLNMWVGARSAFLNMFAWDQGPKRKSLEELKGRPCFAALDLASKVDVAAKVLLFPPFEDDPLYHVHGAYYLPEALVEKGASANAHHYDTWAKQGLMTLTPGEVIDFDVIMDDLRKDRTLYSVTEIPYDPHQATHLASTMLAEDAPMVEMRPLVLTFSEPMKQIDALVRQRKLAHGGCPVLRWMASNVIAKRDAKENVYPRKETEDAKIDGIVALIMALGRFMAGKQEGPSVYESRGLRRV